MPWEGRWESEWNAGGWSFNIQSELLESKGEKKKMRQRKVIGARGLIVVTEQGCSKRQHAWLLEASPLFFPLLRLLYSMEEKKRKKEETNLQEKKAVFIPTASPIHLHTSTSVNVCHWSTGRSDSLKWHLLCSRKNDTISFVSGIHPSLHWSRAIR